MCRLLTSLVLSGVVWLVGCLFVLQLILALIEREDAPVCYEQLLSNLICIGIDFLFDGEGGPALRECRLYTKWVLYPSAMIARVLVTTLRWLLSALQ